jgi:predicted component of type VI protein secretion system
MCQKEAVRLSRREALRSGLVLGSLAIVGSASSALAGDSPVSAQARWLAGVAPLPGIEPGAEWQAYAKAENERWVASQARVKAMQDWSTREVAPLLPPEPAVFYPFAGPDALHGLALFGGARRIVLVGLEPVGALPEPGQPVPAGFFSRLGAALADVHRLTFFRTLEMSNDFQREGVLGALVATIVRMGGAVSSVQTSTTPPSARIDWTTATGQVRRLDYVQADLANAGLKGAAAPVVAMVHGLAPYVTFVKAAMFLLAEPRFSTLKQMILDDSSIVLQDDTGIPFRAFDERWATRLFGRYEAPGAPYEERVQPPLRAAYEQRGATPLGFGIGYHVQAARSNLLVASKGHR